MWADADRRKAEFAHLSKHNGHDPRVFNIEYNPRVTRVGRVLRRSLAPSAGEPLVAFKGAEM